MQPYPSQLRDAGVDAEMLSGPPPIRPYTAAPMLTTVTAGQLAIRGISVGGVYTSFSIPALGNPC